MSEIIEKDSVVKGLREVLIYLAICCYSDDKEKQEKVERMAQAVHDALDLLDEKEAQKFFVDESGKITPLPVVVRCKDCRWAEVSDNEHTWCDHVDHEFCHNNDWFCADGQRNDSNNSSSSGIPNS